MKELGVLQDLFANLAIVTAFLFVASQMLFRHLPPTSQQRSLSVQLQAGLLYGVLGVILMAFTVPMSGTILDFRQLAIIISAMQGGMVSALITGALIGVVRLTAFGPVTTVAIAAAANCLVSALLSGWICRKRSLTYWEKWSFSLYACIVTTINVFLFGLGRNGLEPSMVYTGMMAVGGWLTGSLVQFLIRTKTYIQRMEKEATTDYLTGLHNHRTFDDKYNALLHTAADKGECLSLVLVDIDYFKKVNDTYGHDGGDAVLRQLGQLLSRAARPFDTVSRNGGEEFSVLLYDTPPKHALRIAERVRTAVEAHKFLLPDGQPLRLTVSIGVATYPQVAREELYKQADEALYAAKTSGRNTVRGTKAETPTPPADTARLAPNTI